MENDKYKIEDTEKGKKITFEKGCVVDYEYLWDQILTDSLVQNKNISIINGKNSDLVKFDKKITVEIKAITRNNQKK